ETAGPSSWSKRSGGSRPTPRLTGSRRPGRSRSRRRRLRGQRGSGRRLRLGLEAPVGHRPDSREVSPDRRPDQDRNRRNHDEEQPEAAQDAADVLTRESVPDGARERQRDEGEQDARRDAGADANRDQEQ